MDPAEAHVSELSQTKTKRHIISLLCERKADKLYSIAWLDKEQAGMQFAQRLEAGVEDMRRARREGNIPD